MDSNKEIKVYGTLVNWTVNNDIMDNSHNDAIAYSRQLYDDRFNAAPNADNFQDVINKRLTAISYADGVTTIENQENVNNPYIFVVDGASNLNGDSNVSGNQTVTGNFIVNENTTLNKNLNVERDVVVNGNVDCNNLNIANNARVSGTLDVYHLNPSGGLTVNGSSTFNDGLNINGTVISSTINNSGEIYTDRIHTAHDAQIDENLVVSGTINSIGNISAPNTNDTIDKVNVLVAGPEVPGSVKQQVEAIYQKILVGITPDTIDSLNDIVSWITTHEQGAAALLQQVQVLVNDLNTEIQNRTSSDNTLDGKISTESAARINGDGQLSDRITSEISNRAEAITAEANSRNSADVALGARIDLESNSREVGDQNLLVAITTEATSRQNLINNIYNILTGNGGYAERISIVEQAVENVAKAPTYDEEEKTIIFQ